MFSFLLTTILVYFFGGFLGYWVHWIFHQSWSGPMYRLHKTHHDKMYPPQDYLSEVYRDAGSHNTAPWFAAIIMGVMLPLFFGLWHFGVSSWLVFTAIFESLIIGFMTDWIHSSLHIRGHILERFRVFRVWRTAHWVHHSNVNFNLGIYSFGWDKTFGTWKKPHVLR